MFGFSKYSTATYRVQNVFESIHDPFDLYHISDSIGEVSPSNQIFELSSSLGSQMVLNVCMGGIAHRSNIIQHFF